LPSPTAFVLSGGGSLGAIQVGMLRALYERDIKPDLIVATSVGAINGAFVASRPQTMATADDLAALWRDARRRLVFPAGLCGGLLGLLGARSHLVPESGLRRIVSRHAGRDRLEELATPLHVVAVDVVSGEEQLLSTGPVVDAVMASAAIPALLPPVAWGDRALMDGAIANNTPISHAVRLGARTIYVLPTGHACALQRPPASALGMALHALSLLTHSRLISDIEFYSGARTKLVVLPPPCPLAVTPIDFGHSGELVERALNHGLVVRSATFSAIMSTGEQLDAESRTWIARLGVRSPDREAAIEELRILLLRAARFEIRRRLAASPHLRGGDYDDLAHQSANDALVAILAKLGDFRGDSRFTTWAYKFALLEAAVKIRRRAWQGRELPLEAESWTSMADQRSQPHQEVETKQELAVLRSAIESKLSPHQREVLVAVALGGVPIDVLAERLNTTRGALYKTIHDARRKLRAEFAQRDAEVEQYTEPGTTR